MSKEILTCPKCGTDHIEVGKSLICLNDECGTKWFHQDFDKEEKYVLTLTDEQVDDIIMALNSFRNPLLDKDKNDIDKLVEYIEHVTCISLGCLCEVKYKIGDKIYFKDKSSLGFFAQCYPNDISTYSFEIKKTDNKYDAKYLISITDANDWWFGDDDIYAK